MSGGRISHPLVTPVLEFGHQAVLPPPVPEALGGSLTATFLILMTTGEGEGIVGRGGMKGFPEPNFKANLGKWVRLAPFLQSLMVQLPSGRNWQITKRKLSAHVQILRASWTVPYNLDYQ